MKKLAAMYRPTEGDEFNLDMVECDEDVTDFDLYHDLGKGSMVLIWFPAGYDFDKAYEAAGSQEWADIVGELLRTEANNKLVSAGYAEFVELFTKLGKL